MGFSFAVAFCNRNNWTWRKGGFNKLADYFPQLSSQIEELVGIFQRIIPDWWRKPKDLSRLWNIFLLSLLKTCFWCATIELAREWFDLTFLMASLKGVLLWRETDVALSVDVRKCSVGNVSSSENSSSISMVISYNFYR